MVNGWRNGILSDIIDLHSGRDLLPDQYNDKSEGVPYITGASCFDDNNGLILNRWTKYPQVHTREGDLLLIVKGSGVGKMAFSSLHDAHIARQVMAIRAKSSVDIRFIHAALLVKLSSLTIQASGLIPGIDRKTILAYEISLPPISEQTAIAEALSDADSLIASLEKLIAKKKAIKQGTMQELLTGKKRLPGFSGEWESKPIDVLTDAVAGGTPSTLCPQYWDGHIPWMSSGELHQKRVYSVEGRITSEGLSNSSTSWIPKFCVLIGLAGQGKTRGTVAMNYIELCTNQSIAAIYPNDSNFSSEFLYQNLDNRYDELRELSTGDGGRGGLNLTIIKKLNVFWPPTLEEQTAIASILSDMDAEIEQFEKKLVKYRLIKQGMMQELLTGRIRLVETDKKAETAPKGHNQHYDDAIAISAIVNAFYDDRFILGRVKVQKLLYLLRRKQDVDVSAFKKKAAGPYNEKARYNGGESIAIKEGYVVRQSGNAGSKFGKGMNIGVALQYVGSTQADIDWLLEKFRYFNTNENKENNNLEVLATVDMAVCELTKTGQAISVDAVKGVIRSNKEWAPKLTKPSFTDAAIQKAIEESEKLFG